MPVRPRTEQGRRLRLRFRPAPQCPATAAHLLPASGSAPTTRSRGTRERRWHRRGERGRAGRPRDQAVGPAGFGRWPRCFSHPWCPPGRGTRAAATSRPAPEGSWRSPKGTTYARGQPGRQLFQVPNPARLSLLRHPSSSPLPARTGTLSGRLRGAVAQGGCAAPATGCRK